jgi:O-antigen/teichoic acid export membrane protein
MRRLLSDTAWTGVGHLLSSVLQICLQIYVVRATAPTAFGEYTAAFAIESIVESLVIARSNELALQCVGKPWVHGDFPLAMAYSRRMIRVDWIINWSLFAILVALTNAFSSVLHVPPYYLIGLALMIPAQIGYGVYKGIFISAHKLKEQAMFECSFAICQVLLGIIGVYLFAIPGLIGALVLSALVKTIMAANMTKRWWPENIRNSQISPGQQETMRLESWWRFGLHSILRNAFSSGANQVDILILNAVQGAETVAIYKIAKTLSSLPVRAASPLWSALRPRIMRAWHYRDKQHLRRLVVLPSLLLLGSLVLAAPLAWYFTGDLIVRLYGTAYLPATLPFLILLVGSWLFSAMTAWFVFWVIISEARMAGTLVYGLLLATTLITGFVWGRQSASAMASAVTVSMITASVVCWLIFFRSLKKMDSGALSVSDQLGSTQV